MNTILNDRRRGFIKIMDNNKKCLQVKFEWVHWQFLSEMKGKAIPCKGAEGIHTLISCQGHRIFLYFYNYVVYLNLNTCQLKICSSAFLFPIYICLFCIPDWLRVFSRVGGWREVYILDYDMDCYKICTHLCSWILWHQQSPSCSETVSVQFWCLVMLSPAMLLDANHFRWTLYSVIILSYSKTCFPTPFLQTLPAIIGYANEGAQGLVSRHLFIDVVSTLWKIWMLIRLWKQHSIEACT